MPTDAATDKGIGHSAQDHVVGVERCQKWQQILGDASTAEDQHPATVKVPAHRSGPLTSRRIGAEIVERGQDQSQDVLGNRPRVDAFAAGPEPLAVEHLDERLDPCVGKLHPVDPVVEIPVEQLRCLRIGPHQRCCVAALDHMSTACLDCIRQRLPAPTRWLHRNTSTVDL